MILEGLQHRLMEPDLFKGFVEGFISELNRLQAEQVAESHAVKAELARLPEQIDKLVMAIANGADWRPLNGKMKALEDRREELEARLESLPKEKAPLLHPNLADLYRSKVASLREVLDHGAERERAFELIRTLIEEVRLVPSDGALRVELRGELAGILELCGTGNKKPGTIFGTGLIEQIKMVEGTGHSQNHSLDIIYWFWIGSSKSLEVKRTSESGTSLNSVFISQGATFRRCT